MRALRVVGLGEDGRTVILEDPMRGERFQLPADERLRAAARGDVTRLGQIEIELESQMRPREIQARIRAGESVAQVAEASGLPEDKVERFAYPVLLERSRTADLAQRAHPVREDGPDVQTLGEVCAHAFGLRGQEYSEAVWDSWKNEENKWIVQLRWTAGRSDNRAHWSFHPGAHGGTVTPLDDHAHDLLDPNPNRSLRTVRPVTELARQALAVEAAARPQPVTPEPIEPVYTEPRHQAEPAYQPEPARQPEPEPVYRQPEPEPAPAVAHRPEPQPEPQPVVRPDPVPAAVEPEPAPAPEPEPAPAPAAPAASGKPVQEELVPEPEPKPEAAKDKPAPRRGKKKNHPVVPAWEDVLLGVRSNRG
ncbi:septation protein SepH [Kibdelosporangium persicum]|uniref:DNA-binding protein n=1 Tax=Kibdelosporangium persicum TaxID=2698649 RepID=A0ABX2FGD2_9PSEU|nr:septation protein SepH [Kibdelosporangium persicum]NRN69823.1 DNA-binding protein [Kibdelosporangium persicum]